MAQATAAVSRKACLQGFQSWSAERLQAPVHKHGVFPVQMAAQALKATPQHITHSVDVVALTAGPNIAEWLCKLEEVGFVDTMFCRCKFSKLREGLIVSILAAQHAEEEFLVQVIERQFVLQPLQNR